MLSLLRRLLFCFFSVFSIVFLSPGDELFALLLHCLFLGHNFFEDSSLLHPEHAALGSDLLVHLDILLELGVVVKFGLELFFGRLDLLVCVFQFYFNT